MLRHASPLRQGAERLKVAHLSCFGTCRWCTTAVGGEDGRRTESGVSQAAAR